jgi:hypothetical protein
MATSSRLFVIWLSILCATSLAQGFSPLLSGSPGVVPSLGMGSPQPVLADPRRIQMQQSLSFSAAAGGGSSLSQSFYQNNLTMRLSDPLTLHLDLGILSPLSSSGPATSGVERGAYLIPSVGLEYRPTESLLFLVQYTRLPSAPIGSKGALPWQ